MGMNGNHYPNVKYQFVKDPLEEIAVATEAYINQTPEFLEAYTGFEGPNRYNVFIGGPMGYKYLFKAKENSDFCSRGCCTPSSRPLRMEIIHIATMDEYYNVNLKKNLFNY